MTDDRPTIDRDATITLAQVEYDDLLAERAGLSRHLEDSQAEVARLRDACEGWESLAERIAAVRALHRSHASPEEAQEFMDALGLL